ncbi:Rv2578c family radical SAM protein [Nonomuraea sp. NPDC050328]|uniref:Rv2578c family radical SAM protein n=1 Tax=Nonomuraea sp. NPDC050328 TaxID=3364361 RepID=UPI0037A9F940
MRWDNLRLDGSTDAAASPLFGAVERTFDTPAFRGMTFYEVRARSIINKVPAVSRVPFDHTINPYRGCAHRCVYCFARNTHTYLDLDAGLDFDSKVIVKVNAPELTRRELASPRWRGRPIAMGTNVDCYQRAEGRYRLMPGIITALSEAANPFSILTKGTLILRDLDLLTRAAEVTDVSTAFSVGFVDADAWQAVEPGTPHPHRRLEACRTLNEAGIPCGVLMAPILPYLTDSPGQLDQTVRAIAESGATHLTPIVLHLRPGAREWFLTWLGRTHPRLVPRYLELYGRGAYAPRGYQERIAGQVRELAERYGIGKGGTRPRLRPRLRHPAPAPAPARHPEPEQLALL